jgi:putative oxidoreductase
MSTNAHNTVNTAASVAATTGRFLIATIFLLSGISKLATPAGTIGYIASAGLPFPELAYAVAVTVEVGLATALLFGFQTRSVAAVIALFSLATAFGFHSNLADQNQFIHFFKNVAIAGGLLQVIAFGAGAYSVDAWRARSKPVATRVAAA